MLPGCDGGAGAAGSQGGQRAHCRNGLRCRVTRVSCKERVSLQLSSLASRGRPLPAPMLAVKSSVHGVASLCISLCVYAAINAVMRLRLARSRGYVTRAELDELMTCITPSEFLLMILAAAVWTYTELLACWRAVEETILEFIES